MKIHLFLFLGLITGVVTAQELKDSLTLEEAIAYGLTHNRSIINADREIQKAKKEDESAEPKDAENEAKKIALEEVKKETNTSEDISENDINQPEKIEE